MAGAALMSVAIADIQIGDRIGFLNANHVQSLAYSMAAEGQQAPIQLKRNGNAAKVRWTLVAGLHRLLAAQVNGWTEIDAIQVASPGATDADLRRLELAENMGHRFRRPIERAIMMVEHARLEEAVDYPDMAGETSQVRAARKRWNTVSLNASAMIADASQPIDTGDWRARTAKAFNISLRTLELHQRIHRAIYEELPELAQLLNDHPLGESLSAMTTLAQIKMTDTRRSAAECILSRDDWKSVTEAMVAAGVAENPGPGSTQRQPTRQGSGTSGARCRPPSGNRTSYAWLGTFRPASCGKRLML